MPEHLALGRRVPPSATVGPQWQHRNMAALTDTEKRMLDFETAWFKYAGAKEARIRDEFGLSSTVYYQRLNQLIGRTEALEYSPMVVKRLLRLRDARRELRSARRVTG